jgi:hypothetical protein
MQEQLYCAISTEAEEVAAFTVRAFNFLTEVDAYFKASPSSDVPFNLAHDAVRRALECLDAATSVELYRPLIPFLEALGVEVEE